MIGVLIGTTAVMVWRTHETSIPNSADVSTEKNLETTPTGATVAQDITAAPSDVLMQSTTWPLAPEIPANMRVGLAVPDQSVGKSIAVSGLALTETHWLGIYDDRDGHPGWIMGAARLHQGDTLATVDLLRTTESGTKYYAVILNDDGDDTFNRLSDLPPFSPDKVVIVSFKAK